MFAVIIGNGDLKPSLSSFLDELELGFNYINYDENINKLDLKELGICRADILICLTDKDYINLYLCKKAKIDYNVPKTITLVNCKDNIEAMKFEDIDFIICPDLFVLNFLKKIVSTNNK